MSAGTTQTITGTLTRRASAQTIRVETKITKVHPLYKKRYSQVKHYVAHDPFGTAEIGSTVTIVPCRPVSKTKSWVLAS